jgi:hypothetical protein
MNQEQSVIGYDEFMPQPFSERRRIFNEISAENRALLIKTHIERWLATNRQRLNNEQITVVEETIIPFITPERYRAERDTEKVEQEADALIQKAESVFSREDLWQILAPRADYVPLV